MQLTNLWQGKKVYLRAVEPEDWETFHAWDQDTSFARLTYFIPFPGSQERSKKFWNEESTREPKNHEFRFVIMNIEGQLVGIINSHTCEPRNGTFMYGLAIRREHWRKGYAREAIYLVLRYFFGELRYQKVNVDIYAFNEVSLKLHQKLGFQQEGVLRRMIYTNGQYHDDIILGMTAEEFWSLYPTEKLE
jgi:RimJ/RimL family protein N-acetyltransferase